MADAARAAAEAAALEAPLAAALLRQGRDAASAAGACADASGGAMDPAAQRRLRALLAGDAALAARPPRAAYTEAVVRRAAKVAAAGRFELDEALVELMAPMYGSGGGGSGHGGHVSPKSVGYVSHTLRPNPSAGVAGDGRPRVVSVRCDANVLAGNTGMALWDAGLRLGAELVSGRVQLGGDGGGAAASGRPARDCVIELGAGTAFASLCAVVSGAAAEAVATDGDADAVSMSEHNVEVNGSTTASIRCAVLRWQEDEAAMEAAAAVLPASASAVLAADVCYDPECVPALAFTIGWLLSTRRAPLALVANARRTPGAMEAFREALEAQGLRVEDLTRGTHAALDETPEEAVAALAAAFEVCGFSECGY